MDGKEQQDDRGLHFTLWQELSVSEQEAETGDKKTQGHNLLPKHQKSLNGADRGQE
jgi:hypothetical protein